MSRKLALCAFAIALVVATGCQTEQQLLANQQPEAIQAALARGRFDLNCPGATGTVLSSDFIQPAIQGPFVNGIQRLEYTIGVEGCDKRTTIVVMCQEGSSSCFAANPDERFRGQ
jgi:hypothetical protein